MLIHSLLRLRRRFLWGLAVDLDRSGGLLRDDARCRPRIIENQCPVRLIEEPRELTKGALATRPNYMLLDEPFAGIDPIAVGDIQDLVRHLTNRGIGVLITDHNVRETLGLTDRAYIVYAGEILTEGSPEEIVSDPDVRRLYLGEEFRL